MSHTGSITTLSSLASSSDISRDEGETADRAYPSIVLNFSRAMNRLADRYLEQHGGLRSDETLTSPTSSSKVTPK